MADSGRGTGGGDPDKYVEATRTSLEILEYVKERGPATLSDVARDLGRAKSTVYRHVNTLADAGYLCEYGDGYHVGQLYLDYGIHAQRNHPLYHAAKPKVDALAEAVEEKVWCAVEENGYVVHIYLARGNEFYRSFARVGFRGHLHAFSSGKAILAQMSPERVEEIVATRGLPAYTEATTTDEDALFEELAEIREEGVALHIHEAVSGAHAVAVPVQLEGGSPIGSICVAGPAHRLDEDRMRGELSDRLLGVKDEIEMSLKYEAPSSDADPEPPDPLRESGR